MILGGVSGPHGGFLLNGRISEFGFLGVSELAYVDESQKTLSVDLEDSVDIDLVVFRVLILKGFYF